MRSGIINVAHQHHLRTPTFQPIVLGTIHLHHLTTMSHPIPPLMGPLPPSSSLPQSRLQHQLPKLLPTHLDPFPFPQHLRSQGGTKSHIPILDRPSNPRSRLLRHLPNRPSPPTAVYDPIRPLLPDPLHKPSHLTLTLPQYLSGSPLRHLPLECSPKYH